MKFLLIFAIWSSLVHKKLHFMGTGTSSYMLALLLYIHDNGERKKLYV